MANWRENHKNSLHREVYNRDWLNHELLMWERYTRPYLSQLAKDHITNDGLDVDIRDTLYMILNLNGVQDTTSLSAGEDSYIYHIAHLTAILKSTEWQIGTNYGSQWLAHEIYKRGARAPHGHFHVLPS